MSMRLFLFRVLCFYALTGSVWADQSAIQESDQERPAYTLEDCLAIGLREASAMRNAERDRKIADSAIDQVRAQFMPHVSADASYTRLDKLDQVDFGEQRMELGTLDNYAMSVSLRQLLYSGGSVSAALDAARDYRVMADIETRRVRAALTRDIRSGFTDLLFLGEALVVNAEAVGQWRDALEQTKARYAQDLASEFDVLNARVQWANALPGLIQSSNRLAVAKAAFGDLLNLADSAFDIRGELSFEPVADDLDGHLERAWQDRPELRIARRGLALRETDIRAEKSLYKPSVHVSAQYGAQRSPFDFGGDSDLEWRWSATVRAQWSWLDGGLRRGRVREKELERDKTREDIEALRRRVALEVRQAHLAMRQAAASVAAMRETVGLAEKSMAIAATRYRTGMITRLELAEVNVALMTARLHWLGALRDHAHAVTALRHASGQAE